MKLLLVDDHAIVRAGLRRLLASVDAGIAEAASGREALIRYREDRPDVVVLDLSLPGIGGLELLQRLIIEDANACVLVFSMHAEAIYASRALQAGARGYMSKNATPEELRRRALYRKRDRPGNGPEHDAGRPSAAQPDRTRS
jgi:DNA-binding NarL/FixJ family response regulator